MRWHNVLLLAAAILISGCKEEKAGGRGTGPGAGSVDLAEESGLERWQGKAVYLNFGLRDAGCRRKWTHAGSAGAKNGAIKWWFVAVNTDPETVRINDLLAKHQITYPVVRDQLNIAGERYQVIGTPTSVLIDSEGRVLELHRGMRKAA